MTRVLVLAARDLGHGHGRGSGSTGLLARGWYRSVITRLTGQDLALRMTQAAAAAAGGVVVVMMTVATGRRRRR